MLKDDILYIKAQTHSSGENKESTIKAIIMPKLIPNDLQASENGFHLQPHNNPLETNTTSIPGCTMVFKQRIDAMFDETRSLISAYKTDNYQNIVYSNEKKMRRATSLINGNDVRKVLENENKMLIKNMVQARIEKMFADVSLSNSDSDRSQYKENKDTFTFSVEYLGSVPLPEKVSSLEGLQEPLKILYLTYKKRCKTNPKFEDNLQISSCGLQILYHSKTRRQLIEQVNPFPTIAVWAAVKFVCRPRGLGHGKEFGLEYAFMPLIADPESLDKITLFQRLNSVEASYFTGDNYENHSPLFAAVMRKTGIPRQLECHGFMCATSEDAIVIAAKLYKSLVTTMTQSNIRNCSREKRKKTYLKSDIKCVNGVDMFVKPKNMESELKESRKNVSETKKSSFCRPGNKPPPIRPPRRLKSEDRSTSTSNDEYNFLPEMEKIDLDEILEDTNTISSAADVSHDFHNVKSSVQNKEDISMSKVGSINTPCMRNQEVLRKSYIKTRSEKYCGIQSSCEYPESGDILTKVAIPRSRSFLNAAGPLSSRYSRRSGGMFNANQRKNSLGSPLGLNELFNEFRLQEGLNNVEDILDAIINSDGMSFNDLKPIYKEFLLKLAVTLTKDELYHRSKLIMQRQKNKKQQINRMSSSKFRKTFTAGGGLRKVFRKSVSKLKPSQRKQSSFEFASVLFPSCKKFCASKLAHKANSCLKNYNYSYTSSSTNSFLPTFNKKVNRGFKINSKPLVTKVETIPSRKHIFNTNHFKRTPYESLDKLTSPYSPKIKKSSITTSTSEDSDFFSLIQCDQIHRNKQKNEFKTISQENCIQQTSSGYFSCSECSYDSESCTCTSADKCYCSMGMNKKNQRVNNNNDKNLSLSSCACDTDSCFESEKCYCNQGVHPSLFEQLKQQGFAASESSISRANSPITAWQKNESKMNQDLKSSRKDKTGLQSSRSLEFLQIHRHPHSSQEPLWDIKYKCKPEIYQSRMEVYESKQKMLPQNTNSVTVSSHSKPSNTLNSKYKSYSSDNLAVDYNTFASDDDDNDVQQRKVLVVSACDPKGRIIYMGASCRNETPSNLHLDQSSTQQEVEKNNVSEALSLKKSAEIAALFSEVKIDHKNSFLHSNDKEEVIYNTLEPPDYFLSKGKSSAYMKSNNLENSLGYFP